MAGSEERRRGRGVTIAALALALFVGTGAIYHRTGLVAWNRSDPLLVVPTTLSLLHDGDVELSEYAAAIDPTFYGLARIDGHIYNRYPIGTSLLVLPIVWLAERLPLPPLPPLDHALRLAAWCATVLAAAAVALLFLLVVALDGDVALGLALALLFAFATLHWPLHGRALFSHNAVIPLVLLALLLLVADHGRLAWASAVPIGLAFATRPTSLPVLACFGVFVARHRREHLVRFAVVIVVLAAGLVGWSFAVFGEPLPPYYLRFDHTAPYRMTPALFAEGLLGHLVSPNRGLLVFSPILGFAGWGMAASLRSRAPHAALYRMLSLAVVIHWITVSLMARRWYGGWGYGSRHLAETMPLLVLLLVPAIDAARRSSPRLRRLVAPLAAAALAWSVAVAMRGATSAAAAVEWNAFPVNVDVQPARVWDWHDLQILRGIAW